MTMPGTNPPVKPFRAAKKRRIAPVGRIVPAVFHADPSSVVHAPEAGREAARRAMLADYLKLLAWWLGRPPMPQLPPRLDQTLRGLLAGLSEKQIAATMGVSAHTLHGYVKLLHRRLEVESRGELLARYLPAGQIVKNR